MKNIDYNEKKYNAKDMLDFARSQIFKSLLYGDKAIEENELIKSLINYTEGIKCLNNQK